MTTKLAQLLTAIQTHDRHAKSKIQREALAEEVRSQLPQLGWYRNNWRGRNVYLYDLDGSSEVVTVGIDQAGKEAPVVCIESKDAYRRQLENNDWADYN